MKNKKENIIKTPIKTITISTEFSDYRVNASRILKENSLIKNSFKEKSRNYNSSYVNNFHQISYNYKTRNNISNNTINTNQSDNLYNNNKDNYYCRTISLENINKKRSSFFKFYNPKKNNISRNNITKTLYPNKSEDKFIPIIIKSTGEKKLNELKYGRLKQFNDSSKEIRHEKYIKNILENEFYFKQSEGYINSQLVNITKYGKNVTFNLFNSFYSSFNQYSKLLSRNLDVEKDKNENEILKENKLRNEINRLKLKKEVMLKQISLFMEMKKFLLCVKNKTLDINKFNEEDNKIILYDKKRKKLIINDYLVPQKLSHNLLIKKRENKLRGKTFILKNYKTLSSTNLINLRRKSTNLNYEIYYTPSINEKIFNNVEEVENIFLSLSEKIKNMLSDFNKNKIEIEKLKTKLREINEENQINIIKINKFNTSSEILNKVEKRKIVINKYNNLIFTKNNILKSSFNNDNNLFEVLFQKINKIFNYINLNYQKYEKNNYKKDEMNPIVNQLNFIEKILNELILKRNKLKIEQPEKYKEITKIIINKVKHELFLKNKKIQKEKHEKDIENIKKRINKIYFLPIKKLQEKFSFSHKKNENNKKNHEKTNLKTEAELIEFLKK